MTNLLAFLQFVATHDFSNQWLLVSAYGTGLVVGAAVGVLWTHAWHTRHQ